MSGSHKSELVYCPLGGAGEIGMNLYLYGLGAAERRRWLIVDMGVTFANDGQPGIDLVFPDIGFLEAERGAIDGLVLTHAHEDHFGAVLDLLPRLNVPVYATPFTASLLGAKAIENGVDAALDVHEIAVGARFAVGAFDLEFIPVAHSIPEPQALVIRTAAGTVVHSGDWKLDQEPITGKDTDLDRLEEIGDEGVLALICDSTNAMRAGDSPSEGEVARVLTDIVCKAPHRVAVTIFASNVARLKSVVAAAQTANREVVIVGRAMHRVIAVARETGYIGDDVVFRSEDDYGYFPRDKVLLLCTGSQGEPRAAMARIARDDHPRITFAAGDTVIFSSRTIPGNERAVGAVQNALVQAGVRLVTDADALVHVSGHPRRDELAAYYDRVRPKLAIPMHGEARHMMAHADLARSLGVPHVVTAFNGDMVGLDLERPAVVDTVRSGRIYKDGQIMIDSNDPGLRERRKLAYAGAIFVSLSVSAAGDIVGEPEVSLVGLPEGERDPLLALAYETVDGALDAMPRARRRDPDLISETVRRSVIGQVRSIWGKKPACEVHVAQI